MRTTSFSFALFFSAAAAATACTGSGEGPECNSQASGAVNDACGSCEADGECESGVCVEANGACAVPGELIYVTTANVGADVGTCTIDAPCRTLHYAMRLVTPQRRVIRLDGERLVTASSIVIDRPVAI